MTLLGRAVRKVVRAGRRVLGGGRAEPAAPTSLTAETVDLDAQAVALDPFPAYDRLRVAGAVQFLQRHNAWIVLGYDELRVAFSMPQLLSNRPYDDVDAVLLAADPPEHTAIRRIASRYFARDLIEAIGRETAAEARALLRKGKLDAVRDYAGRLSEIAAARLIGLDDDTLREFSAAGANATAFAPYVAELRAFAPRAAIYEGLRNDGLSEVQARSLVALFWVASTKTTERTIAACAYRLLRHDDVRRELQRNPSAVAGFIEEVLRLHQPEPMLRRLATAPVALGGTTIPEGAMVYLCLAAANRDASRYEQPHDLRLDRPAAGHLSFGHGIHFCIGATLARTVVHAAVRALLDVPSLRPGEPLDRVKWQASMMVLFIESLAIET